MNKVKREINNQQNQRQRKQGDVTIHYQEGKGSKIDKNVGEYVDYEEIKD